MDLDRIVPAADWLPIAIFVTSDHRFARLNVGGELDASTSPDLRTAVEQVVASPAAERVELNLAELTFIDSAGIRCLLACRTAVHEARGRLVLINPRPQVVRTLEITGLVETFELAPDDGGGWPRRTSGSSPHRPRPLEDLFEESVALRQAAQEACARARAARSAGLIGELWRD